MGILDVDALLSRLTAKQLIEWEAYFELEPFGQDHTDLLIAKLIATVASAHGAKNVRATSYLPYYETPEMTADEVSSTVKGFLARWQS